MKKEWNGEFQITQKMRQTRFQMAEAHCHDFYELYYLVSGERKFFIKDSVYYLQPHDVVLVNRNDLHKTTYLEDGKHERIVVMFDRIFAEELAACVNPAETEQFLCSRKIRLQQAEAVQIEQLLCQAIEEIQKDDTGSEFMSRIHICEVLIRLMRQSRQDDGIDAVDEVLLNDMEKEIQNAARYIYHHYDKSIKLKEIAEQAGMSEHYFSKRFKRVTGFGFKEYVTAVRINHARELLKSTSLSITEVGIRCGFSDGNYFGDVFRKMVGVAPIKYRNGRL